MKSNVSIKVVILIVIVLVFVIGVLFFSQNKVNQEKIIDNNQEQVMGTTSSSLVSSTPIQNIKRSTSTQNNVENIKLIDTDDLFKKASDAFSRTECGKYPQRGDLHLGSWKTDSMMIYGLFGDRCGMSCSYNSITGEVTVGDYRCE